MADPTTVTPVFNVPVAPQAAPAAPVTAPKQRSTFDNILGFLGDFLLSRLHMGTPYRDARENEKLNYARQLDLQDPSQQFKNVGAINAALGAQLAQQAIANRARDASLESVQESRATRIAAQDTARRTSYLNRAANIFNAGLARAKTPEEAAKIYDELYPLRLQSQELTSDPELMTMFTDRYPKTFDPSVVAASIGEAVPVQAQWANSLNQQKADDTAARYRASQAQAAANEAGRNERAAAGRAVTMRGQDIHSDDAAANRVAAGQRNAARIAARPDPAPKTPKPTAADIIYLRKNPEMRDRFDGRFGVGMAKRVLNN